MLQQAELSRYRALDEERRIWEGRERLLEEELHAARARGSQSVDIVTATRLTTAEEQLRDKISQLESSEVIRREITRKRDTLRRDNLELQELRAELTTWRARQQRLEALSEEVHSDVQMPVVDNRTIGTEDDEMGQPETTRRTQITLPTTPQPVVGLSSEAWTTTHSTPTAAERLPVTSTSALPIHLALSHWGVCLQP